ncbi:GNAT family N-acetyltransferase [Thalassomonas actiniarum]|uniref:GNAT family N-acetyltransferase n=1 Tax=Thalassomonas actiniarum TaxID=485447 RepID=A0AAE9YUK5_9GAMM|nr:GNAT family N-acetyltransferase [Thalassomonas actiniarum]WDD99926.1 GNAT family N-acetyltransferase [Thalassomonas actiniarum]
MIRTVRPGDIGWIISKHGLIYSSEFNFDLGFEVDIARKIVSLIDKKDEFTRLWLKEVDGNKAGSIAVSKGENGIAFINFVLVMDHYRGKGIARELMNCALAHAEQNGFAKVCLETYSCLTSARNLYAQLGFRLSEPVKRLRQYNQNIDQEFWELDLHNKST